MSSNSGSAAVHTTRQQALMNLALKRDPITIRQKPNVAFADESPMPPRKDIVDELPTLNAEIHIISSARITTAELPPASPIIRPTSARSLSTISPGLKRRTATVSPTTIVPLEAPKPISPLVPLLVSAILLLVLGTAGVFLPPYLLSLRTHQGRRIFL